MSNIPVIGLRALSSHVERVNRLAKLMQDEEHQRFDHVLETAVGFGYNKVEIKEAYRLYVDNKVVV